ncbi:nitrite reductase (NAD(P)H) small subunit [Streptomyces tateyamensis]|uniref:Nitrite reductase (NAD(P)H) small subunit n=1 Tax=Streptomyces tateyamensis TaxID=565073 RepID=A0A2V4NMB6_9ACTN|nr:nitrite reductase small subunit NirD [Streptomyces tateyamensis]PYC77034.1 nitrite reductase (NAD(P)H) small subunit [Streptomyces tateyamensis]
MTAVEIDDGQGWRPVCELDDLIVGRGVAVLLPDGTQAAVFRTRGDELFALDNRDPFSGAYVMSRGLTGSRGGVPVVVSPMLKQAFDLRTGQCLDEESAPDGSPAALRTWPVRAAQDALAVAG